MTLLHYKGKVTFEKIGQLVDEMEALFTGKNYTVNVYKKVLSAMVELLENIHKHHAERDNNLHSEYPDIFELKRQDGSFVVEGSNLMDNNELPCTQKHIERIKNYNKEQAKRVYKEIIGNGRFSDKGGAGLGFLEIRRVSENNFNYQITPVNDEYSYFTLKIYVKVFFKKEK